MGVSVCWGGGHNLSDVWIKETTAFHNKWKHLIEFCTESHILYCTSYIVLKFNNLITENKQGC